jgi:hypothetical protein
VEAVEAVEADKAGFLAAEVLPSPPALLSFPLWLLLAVWGLL